MALPLQSWFFIAIGAPGGDSDGNKRNIDTSGNPNPPHQPKEG